jgi:MATE family multidrug resistance protein
MTAPTQRHLPRRTDFAELLQLAIPIVIVQLGLMLMGVVDTVMVGRLSAAALAAVAIANIYFFTVTIFGLGTLLALDPIIAQALGARDELAVERGLQRGLVLALVLTVPVSLLLLAVEPVLVLFRQPAEVTPVAAGSVYRALPSVWPLFAFVVLRQTLQAYRRTTPVVVTIVTANILNAILNYAWIFGELGFPAMGVLGSAWATAVSRTAMVLLMLILGWPSLHLYLRHRTPGLLSPQPILRMLRLGAPIGLQMVLEFGAFSTVAVLMGWLGVIQVAAHQVAINLASLTFMVPMGVSSAATVIVGHGVGRGDADSVRRATAAALIVGAGFMSLTAALFIGMPETLAALYTKDLALLQLAALLLPIAGVFQIFDGLQVVAIGLLRGLGDTRVPVIANIIAFWCIGIPVSLWLGFGLDFGAVGLWWGLVAGLFMVATFLIARLKQTEKWKLARLVIDTPPEPVVRAAARPDPG